MDQNPFEQKIREANEQLRAQSVPGTAALIAVLICTLLLSVASLAATSVIDPQTYQSGNVLFAKDSPGFNFAVLLLFAAAVRVLRAARISERFLWRSAAVLLTLLGGAGLLWILLEKALPAGDQLVCYNAANALVHGDTSALTDESGAFFFFFVCSPNRFGTLFYTEILMRAFGEKGILLAAPALNVLLMLFGYALLLRLTNRLFGDRRVTLLTLLFLCVFFQPILSCTVIDGAAVAFAFSVWALEKVFLYLKNGKKRELIGAAAFFLLAALFRPFALAAAGAATLALLIAAPNKKSRAPLIAGIVVLAAAGIGLFAPRALYQARLDTDYGAGLSPAVWRAAEQNAGETENMEEVRAYFDEQKEAYGLDFAAFAAQAKIDLAAAEQTGADSASERLARRISAVWNEPTFGALWASGAFEPFGERSELALSLSGGAAAQTLNRAWNQLMQLLYAGTFLSAAVLLIRRTQGKTLLPLTVLLGVVFCLFSGPSAGNAVWFLPLFCPLAALGVLTFGLDVTALFTRPATTWEQAKQERGNHRVK